MHNNTRFASLVRQATDQILDAVASTDAERLRLLRSADSLLEDASKEADYAEEVTLVDRLADFTWSAFESHDEPSMAE